MPRLNLAVPHGQPWELARANFEKGISDASTQHAIWIQRVEWSSDRTAATLYGPGYEVLVSLDAEKVYATGTIPIFPWLLEQPLKRFLEGTFGKQGS
jgi:hypothetical protein